MAKGTKRVLNPDTNKFEDVPMEEEYDHGKRLAEIYEHFMLSYEAYHGVNPLLAEPGEVNKKFDPAKVRAKLERQFRLVDGQEDFEEEA